ncbi:MAG: 4-alpha-glucanotransferase [Lautropia sp.]
MQRASGILLHPTSLPGALGCGDFGDDAYRFVDWLAQAGQRLWQVLPLTPPGPGWSPYMSASTHAGNPALVSTERLEREGLLDAGDSLRAWEAGGADAGCGAGARIDVGRVCAVRDGLLAKAASRFFDAPAGCDAAGADPLADARRDFVRWCEAEAGWLDDYALFQALDARHATPTWQQWPTPLARRDPGALRAAAAELSHACRLHRFVQWCFDVQWRALRRYAADRQVRIVGDLPIYCALHSADVWANPRLFELDDALMPVAVAGVPPDYFSATGQLWGNPLYDWPAHAADGFGWWIGRMRSALRHADIVRIDHFRAFAGYWAVPAGATTAIDGHWRVGPGRGPFDAMRDAFGTLPVIAEDLGTITPDVLALRDALGLPGMAVLQFAFGDTAANPYLPHNLTPRCAVYTGTHDNDTTRGWFASATAAERERVQQYLECDGSQIHWDLIRAASSSVADLAIYPLQDVLGLDSDARMNVPSLPGAQWRWRFAWSQVQDWQAPRLARLTRAHGRSLPWR